MILELETLSALEVTCLDILEDHKKRLMGYQRLIARYPIQDTSVQFALASIVKANRSIRAREFDLSEFPAVIEQSYNAMSTAGELMVSRYESAFVDLFGAGAVMLMRSGS